MAAPLRPETPAEQAAAAGWPAELEAFRQQRRAEREAAANPSSSTSSQPTPAGRGSGGGR